MRVFIGLGSNLADPEAQVKSAITDIDRLSAVQFLRSSSLYKSPPMGPQDQPDYINAVIEVQTHLSAHELLDYLQKIEQQHGRLRQRHWGERTLDLDLLIFGENQIDDERLQVPHPGIAERSFVLYPLAEIAPELVIPGLGEIRTLLKHCPVNGLIRIENSEI
jgi:2-amino-4-hydroxy-6-hydroxymethyldihydropteridine diphosphokinase